MAYLYLFYEDYIYGREDPATTIANKKASILQQASSKINIRASGSWVVEHEFEKLYSLTEGEFANAGVISRLETVNKEMHSFDDAIAQLKALISEQGTLNRARDLCDTCITGIDNILKMGASTHGLADSAYQEVINFKKQLQSVRASLRHGSLSSRTKAERDEILSTIGAVQSNISGYLLEIAWIYAFLGANKLALGAMVNIGGHSTNIGAKYRDDPRMKEDIEKIDRALFSNKVQSKADAVFNLSPNNVSGTTQWVGFQLKNFSDITSIHVGNFTLGQVLSEAGYDNDFLVNIVGTLAGNQYQAKNIIPPGKRVHKENLVSQSMVDNLWRDLKNSTKPLAVADTIAGAMNANFTNKVNYYVIRSKSGNSINVIPVSRLLTAISNAFSSGTDKIFGINAGVYEGTSKAATRSEYWSINVAAYDETDADGSNRSSKAYSQILNAINQTKVSISINFSQVLNQLTY